MGFHDAKNQKKCGWSYWKSVICYLPYENDTIQVKYLAPLFVRLVGNNG